MNRLFRLGQRVLAAAVLERLAVLVVLGLSAHHVEVLAPLAAWCICLVGFLVFVGVTVERERRKAVAGLAPTPDRAAMLDAWHLERIARVERARVVLAERLGEPAAMLAIAALWEAGFEIAPAVIGIGGDA